MFKKPAVLIMSSGVGLFLGIEFLRLFNDGALDNFWRFYNGDVIEPLEFISVFLFATGLFLLFFNSTIQHRWWRWARWVMLGSIPVIMTGATSGFGWLYRTDLAIMCSSVLLGSTIVYSLYQRFYLKTGVVQ